ncbi:MAG: dehydrogenase [Fluviicola sp.]|nr:MAG: dehydrogenase [Fluviicola sp.]
MANDKQDFQVVIIGGGPAGIATSLTLTSRGISNCIVEADAEPTRKSGEAIPPNAKPLLKKLGIFHLLEDPKHLIYYGNESSWGTDKLEQEEFIQGIYGSGYLLDRLHFEKQLRAHLKTNDGVLFMGYRLRKVVRDGQGIQVNIKKDKDEVLLTTRYIVDATGRKASVCSHLGIKKQAIDSQFAVTFKALLNEQIAHKICVEATENGWWYAAPQQGKELMIMFFTLKQLIPNKSEVADFLKKELDSSLHLSKLLQTAKLDLTHVKIMPCGTSRLDTAYGENWLAVGDAACSYDPISSYGITSALGSGLYAGHALTDALANKKDAMLTYQFIMETTFQEYMERLMVHYDLEKRWAKSVYWKDRFLQTEAITRDFNQS